MILVTGATGLVGSHLVRLLLSNGHKVRAIKRSTSDISLLEGIANRVEWVEADVLDIPSLELAFRGVTQLYHCAAIISFNPKDTDLMMRVNIDGTANVMNAALKEGVQKVVHISSIAALGIAPEGRIIDEQYIDPNINKCFWYYKSKHYGEREVWRAHAEGLNVVVLNPSTILSPGFWDREPISLFNDVYNGLSFYTTAKNGFVDVRDVANCALKIMESEISGERFIVSEGNYSFQNVLDMMADSMNVKRPRIKAGPSLLKLAWMTELVKSFLLRTKPMITKESMQAATLNFQYSNSKIKNALRHDFIPISKTIADTAEVFLESRSKGLSYGYFS